MARKKLTIQERVIKEPKVLEMSMEALREALDKSGGDYRPVLKVKAKGCSVKLVLRCKRPDIFAGWTMVVVLDQTCIGLIDWHVAEYQDTHGIRRIGWHKHVWSVAEHSCKNRREHLPNFNPVTIEEFIRDGFMVLGIEFAKGNLNVGRQMRID